MGPYRDPRVGGVFMKRLILILAVALFAAAMQVAAVSATHWCAMAYDEKLGTNFGTCPGPPH